ncbi:E3 ubiquitin-protein ligase TRIM15-like isoform X2 [Emydura macquarii macquarii]|uniref:E3 ubiquitin-protein ligase TRIM15-like isoform X2 n=1 Tax=Emydura macquarii macquarii TaxID=1129001 RepID=UPI00352AB3AC
MAAAGELAGSFQDEVTCSVCLEYFTEPEQILSRLQRVREEREELQGLKSDWDKESERLLRQTEVERQLVVSEVEQLRQFLAEQERLLLARLGELDEEIGRRREENSTQLCEEISRLSALITELEGKCQQPAPELLQGVRSAMSRYIRARLPLTLCLAEKRLRDLATDSAPRSPTVGRSHSLDPAAFPPYLPGAAGAVAL